MNYIEHPEILQINIGETFRGGLFAMPVLLHPQLLASSGDPLAEIDYEAVGNVMQTTGVMSRDAQEVALLSRVVDASFVSSARGDMQIPMLKALIALHRSIPTQRDALDMFKLSGYDHSGGGLVFLLGVAYRRNMDVRPVTLPEPSDFLLSHSRLAMESALGGAASTMFRHQILPPFTLSRAIGEGVSAAVKCWSGMHEEQLRCEMDLTASGDVTLELSDSRETAVSLRFEHDAVTPEDLALIQSRAFNAASFSIARSNNFLH